MADPGRVFLAPPSVGEGTRGQVPTFSVIIAAYQAADTIAEAVASALGQTLPPHEVIVCDDGSTDDLAGALAPYRDRIILLRQDQGGAASARNRALRSATGEFVALLDSDDAFLPGRLAALGELAAARPDLDILSTDALFEVDGVVTGRFLAENRFAIKDQRTAIIEACFVGWPAVRRQRLLAIGSFDESLATSDDWDAWIRLILAGSKAGLAPEPLLLYRLRPGSLSADRARSLRERVVILDKTSKNPHLLPEERTVLVSAQRAANARALASEARGALLAGSNDARARGLALALGSGVGFPARALGAGAAVMPRLAGRLLARRYAGAPLPDDRAPAVRA